MWSLFIYPKPLSFESSIASDRSAPSGQHTNLRIQRSHLQMFDSVLYSAISAIHIHSVSRCVWVCCSWSTSVSHLFTSLAAYTGVFAHVFCISFQLRIVLPRIQVRPNYKYRRLRRSAINLDRNAHDYRVARAMIDCRVCVCLGVSHACIRNSRRQTFLIASSRVAHIIVITVYLVFQPGQCAE